MRIRREKLTKSVMRWLTDATERRAELIEKHRSAKLQRNAEVEQWTVWQKMWYEHPYDMHTEKMARAVALDAVEAEIRHCRQLLAAEAIAPEGEPVIEVPFEYGEKIKEWLEK
jgi:hypothetical protein